MFALNRKALGRSLNKAVPVSVVGIFSYDGAQVSRASPAGQPRARGPQGTCGDSESALSSPLFRDASRGQRPRQPSPCFPREGAVPDGQRPLVPPPPVGRGRHLCPRFRPRTSSTGWWS